MTSSEDNRSYYDPEVPMCRVCTNHECSPTLCVRVTTLIRVGSKESPEALRKAHMDKLLASKPKFSTQIKADVWAMKMRDLEKIGYFWEYKEDKKYWNTRLGNIQDQVPLEGNFLVGGDREPKKYIIEEIRFSGCHIIPAKYKELGIIETPYVWAIKCVPMPAEAAPAPADTGVCKHDNCHIVADTNIGQMRTCVDCGASFDQGSGTWIPDNRGR